MVLLGAIMLKTVSDRLLTQQVLLGGALHLTLAAAAEVLGWLKALLGMAGCAGHEKGMGTPTSALIMVPRQMSIHREKCAAASAPIRMRALSCIPSL